MRTHRRLPLPTGLPTGLPAGLLLGLLTGLLAGLLTACSGSPDVRLAVTPGTALYDAPLRVAVSGLDGGQRVTLTTTTEDADHHEWRSAATFRADSAGRVTDRQAPVDGDWGKGDPQGPIDALARVDGVADYFRPPHPWRVTVTVADGGDRLARRTVTREVPVPDGLVTQTPLRPARGGLYGELFEPTHPTGDESAVLLLGGSEGGASPVGLAALLAAHGHPALALAYFHAPGLPSTLERIPVEYLVRGVARLRRAPHVDPRRVVVYGDSRGSEAAVLTALHDPDRVAGVVAGVPSSKAGPGLPDRTRPAWTWRGRGVPTSRDRDPAAADDPAAAFDLGAFPGPVLAICGGQDQVWPSCPFAEALRATSPTRVRVLSYPLAGHAAGYPVPLLPVTLTGGATASGTPVVYGGTPYDDAAARGAAWPQVLAFVDDVGRSPR